MSRIIRTVRASSHWSQLLGGAALGGLAAWLVLRARRSSPPPELDLEGLTDRLLDRAGADGLRLRALGKGIIEVVGSAGAELDLPELLAALGAQPGVSVVVNRVWTADPVEAQ